FAMLALSDWVIGLWWLGALGTYVVTLLSPQRRPPPADPQGLLPVTVLVPVRGIDADLARNLAAFLRLDYPRYEVVFAVHDDSDPALPVIRQAIAENPRVPTELSIGTADEHANPKIGNLFGAEASLRQPLLLLSAAN